ncbi:MAG TPA: peptidase M22 [Oscillospiraceae bacterium]|nr:peptidase M22 [Oscillospiraceae bacterium]HXK76937.1 peptidase M22 [Oscillospiraceae bacterium]
MPLYLGIDTSNYTTSAALYDGGSGKLVQKKRLLPVKEGTLGLRQSDAVFEHVRQLGEMVSGVFLETGAREIAAVGVSNRPRDIDGSYMPCFLVGIMAAECVAVSHQAPLDLFSHQQGHVAAALYSAGRLDLLQTRFIAFHVSGGTTECLLVEPDEERIFRCEKVADSLDLKAGQAVDRVGVMLGLPFPAGPELEKLAQKSDKTYKIKPTMKDGNCCLSGIENRCETMRAMGENPEDIARFCLDSIAAAVSGMTDAALATYGKLPVLYAGGVMSNAFLREHFEKNYGGIFAEPVFSSDNAAGIAVLASIADRRRRGDPEWPDSQS